MFHFNNLTNRERGLGVEVSSSEDNQQTILLSCELSCKSCHLQLKPDRLSSFHLAQSKLYLMFGKHISNMQTIDYNIGFVFIGWVYDATQDFNSVFMYSGVVFLLNALVILLIPLTQKLKAQQKSKVGELPLNAGTNMEQETEMVKDVRINHI